MAEQVEPVYMPELDEHALGLIALIDDPSVPLNRRTVIEGFLMNMAPHISRKVFEKDFARRNELRRPLERRFPGLRELIVASRHMNMSVATSISTVTALLKFYDLSAITGSLFELNELQIVEVIGKASTANLIAELEYIVDLLVDVKVKAMV